MVTNLGRAPGGVRRPGPDFDVVVLAGERGASGALAAAAGVARKVLAPVGGAPVILNVLGALDATDRFAAKWLSGPDRPVLEGTPALLEQEALGWRWRPVERSPAMSAAAALGATGGTLPVLLTTADHAFLSREIVDFFCDRSKSSDGDVTIAFARHDEVMRVFPGSRRTGWRFSDGRVCGCNLYGFMTPGAQRVASFWQRVETLRKKPWRIVALLGPRLLARYVAGRLTLDEALTGLSRATGATIRAVILPFPEAAVDLDTPADWELVKRHLRWRDE